MLILASYVPIILLLGYKALFDYCVGKTEPDSIESFGVGLLFIIVIPYILLRIGVKIGTYWEKRKRAHRKTSES